jgi:hypothetical protein
MARQKRSGWMGMSETTDRKRIWVGQVLGIRFGAKTDPGKTPNLKGMIVWTAARAKAIAALKEAEAAVRAFEDPNSNRAILELRAFRANLTEKPETDQQIKELETYIGTDEVVADAEGDNSLGISLQLRQPLLAALTTLRNDLFGGAGEQRNPRQ